jgi:hypothetical protein
MRGIVATAVALAVLGAAPAEAKLVFVKHPTSVRPDVYVSRDDGTRKRRVSAGRSPVVSDDGRWIAWVAFGSLDKVLVQRSDLSGEPRRILRSRTIGKLAFSPDSTQLGIAAARRLVVHDLPTDTHFTAASGHITGFSFSPDSRSVVYGTTGSEEGLDAETDLYIVTFDAGPRMRLTRDRRSLNPVWGPDRIIFDRMRPREGDAPVFNLFEIQPDGSGARRITGLTIPSLLSGLVPIELDADGERLLAEFTGQDTAVAFAVDPDTGDTRALDRDMENGFVGTDISAGGRWVLGHTGGPDPSGHHDVVRMRYGGKDQRVLVERAMDPDWSR